jgi:hypothetical protein
MPKPLSFRDMRELAHHARLSGLTTGSGAECGPRTLSNEIEKTKQTPVKEVQEVEPGSIPLCGMGK